MNACILAYSCFESDPRLQRYVRTLLNLGHNVDILCLRRFPTDSRHELWEGANIYRIFSRFQKESNMIHYLIRISLFFLVSFFAVLFLNFKNSYDIFHVNNPPDFLVFTCLFSKLNKSTLILDIHDITPELFTSRFKDSKFKFIYNILLFQEFLSCKFADKVIVANHIWADKIAKRNAIKSKVYTILNSPDLNFINSLPSTEKQKLIIYPGSLSKHQGVDVAIKAFSLFSKYHPEYKFHIYGDGPHKHNLEVLASELNLSDKIIFFGTRPYHEIMVAMKSATLGIEPKTNNGFSNNALSMKIMEFMAAGTPSVVSKTSAHTYYFANNNVIFFNPSDHVELYYKMSQVLNDRKLYTQLVVNGKLFLASNSWEFMEIIYTGLLKKPS